MFSLSDEERNKFCDPKFYQLIKVLMIPDSESYTFMKDKHQNNIYRQEFLKNNQVML